MKDNFDNFGNFDNFNNIKIMIFHFFIIHETKIKVSNFKKIYEKK